MPYRIDIDGPPHDALDILVQLGALDIEPLPTGLAALLPDSVSQEEVARALRVSKVVTSNAVGRDDGSVWLLTPRPIRIGSVLITSPERATPHEALRLFDSNAFGTGHHPTTALCLEALEEILSAECVDSVLDVGTGSGILALAALRMGVTRAIGIDIDAEAIRVAAENARLNDLAGRLQLILGGPELVNGHWPLIIANVLAAPLIAMAPILTRLLAPEGRLILSGISQSLEGEVRQAYRHFGIRHIESETRAGWTALTAWAPW